MTASGFSFIDESAKLAQSVDQLEWTVAHYIAQELMLAFGIGKNCATTSHYIDAKVATTAMLLDASATYSGAGGQALLAQDFLTNGADPSASPGAMIAPAMVPKPGAALLWTVSGLAVVLEARRRASRRSSAAPSRRPARRSGNAADLAAPFPR